MGILPMGISIFQSFVALYNIHRFLVLFALVNNHIKIQGVFASKEGEKTDEADESVSILWCSLVEPTPVYPGGRHGNNSRPHAKIATGSA